MAITYWNKLTQDIVNDTKTRQAVREQLNKKVHHVYVSTENLENYINKYLKNALQEDASDSVFSTSEQEALIKNYEHLAEKFYEDIVSEAKLKKAPMSKLHPGQCIVTCVGGYNTWAAIRRTPVNNFIKRLKAIGINTQNKIKMKNFNTNKQETGSTEKFIRQGIQFSHTSPTTAAAHFKKIFTNMEDKVKGTLENVKGNYETSELHKVLEERLSDMYELHLDTTIIMEDMKTGRKAKDTYEVRGEFVDARTNVKGGKMKDAPMVGKRVRDTVRDILTKEVGMKGADLHGSPKMSERAADAIIDRFRKKIKSKNITVKSEKLEKVKKRRTIKNVKGKASRRSPRKLKAGKNIETLAGVGVGLRKQVSKENTRRSNIALAGLMRRLNAALPYMLQRHMVPPKLQYRGLGNPRSGTGPFTSTARVTSLIPMNKEDPDNSGVNVNYTYGLFPYQTFEPGFAQGSFYRDPRKLIEESLMELMRNIKSETFMKGVSFRRTATGADYKFKRRGK